MQVLQHRKHEVSTSSRLNRERENLISGLSEVSASEFMDVNSQLIDEYLRKQFETSMVGPELGITKNPYVFVALGGYGRGEQCVHSDVDLLFLFKKRVPGEAENLIREMVYPLWDIGMEVGYATRSLKECLSLAAKDYETLTPLLDARFICGMSPLYLEMTEQLQRKLLERHSRKIIEWLIERNLLRHQVHGDSTYRLEPNLKEGQGGLRDYHSMLWLTRIKYQLKQPRDLEYLGRLSHDEYLELTDALNFIWDVRNRLHVLCGRKCDQLHFENQIKLAELMNFKRVNGQQPVETFLGELHGRMDFIKEHYLMLINELGYWNRKKPRKPATHRTAIEGLSVDRGMLFFASPEQVVQNPQLLISIFQESLRLKLPLSAEAKRMVKEFSYLADRTFINSGDVVKAFHQILLAPAPVFNVLKEMLNTGFLEKLIPAFHDVVNRIQYDEYHLYPVDKHLLRTVQTIKNFANSEDPSVDPLCSQLYRGLKRKKLLLWAALLHDIGKGSETDDHSESGASAARSILAEKGLSPKEIDSIAFLIEKHLFLIKIATRRDIHDEETAIMCAREIGNTDELKMLYLLTAADCMSTGPNAWNDWTATLLRDLFLKVLNILEKGELASREAVKGIEKKKQRVLDSFAEDRKRQEMETLFNLLSPRYLLYATTDQILEDIGRYQRLGDREFVWDITRSAVSDTRTIKICAKDRPGLFSNIAGVLTLNGIDIVDAQVFTWRNQIAMDIFEVRPPPDKLFEEDRWLRAEQNLSDALTGQMNLAAALKKKIAGHRRRKSPPIRRPNRVVVDNNSSNFYTIIEVFTEDYPGLLFNITDALFTCRLDIWVAKIATKVDQVVDVFYVRDFDGQKVDAADQVEQVKSTVMKRLL